MASVIRSVFFAVATGMWNAAAICIPSGAASANACSSVSEKRPVAGS
jgi:hypothetical protein